MSTLYVVRRPFRSFGVFYAAGIILDDLSNIKLSRIKVNDNLLIPIPEDTDELGVLHYYFENKLGIDLHGKLAEYEASKGSKNPEPQDPSASITPPPGTNEIELEDNEHVDPIVTDEATEATVAESEKSNVVQASPPPPKE